jgi:hypothetical protein
MNLPILGERKLIGRVIDRGLQRRALCEPYAGCNRSRYRPAMNKLAMAQVTSGRWQTGGAMLAFHGRRW